MKKRSFILMMPFMMALCLTGYYEDEEPEHVLNAEIVEIDADNKF